ncbi:hypothetical protein EX30DRAFT_342666 [Ascodesmis nigricans]|uniref:Uncharacterized protein n=1 Tax=Ascodesmis nigricans TaxID=341454 RepID=A0A4S2MSN5_9PEZI|nr:hypothetical protein EX30DRAFT_342666 [Ascodesmis nigricans]
MPQWPSTTKAPKRKADEISTAANPPRTDNSDCNITAILTIVTDNDTHGSAKQTMIFTEGSALTTVVSRELEQKNGDTTSEGPRKSPKPPGRSSPPSTMWIYKTHRKNWGRHEWCRGRCNEDEWDFEYVYGSREAARKKLLEMKEEMEEGDWLEASEPPCDDKDCGDCLVQYDPNRALRYRIEDGDDFMSLVGIKYNKRDYLHVLAKVEKHEVRY